MEGFLVITARSRSARSGIIIPGKGIDDSLVWYLTPHEHRNDWKMS
jgi:hypothetical protein